MRHTCPVAVGIAVSHTDTDTLALAHTESETQKQWPTGDLRNLMFYFYTVGRAGVYVITVGTCRARDANVLRPSNPMTLTVVTLAPNKFYEQS